MLGPLLLKAIRSLRAEEKHAPPLPPFFSVEMPWVIEHLVNIDANQQTVLHMLRDENGRSRILDIQDRLQVMERRLQRVERREKGG
jgi:hypothetical protein